MKNYILPLLLAIVALAFGGIYIAKSTAPDKPEVAEGADGSQEVIGQQAEEIAALKAKLAEAELAAKSKPAPEPIQVVSEPAPAEPEAPAADDELATLSPEQRERREQRERMSKMIGDIMTNFSAMSTNENAIAQREEMGRMWRDQQQLESQRRVAEEYGDLLSKFDLSIDERKEFLALLAKKRGGRGWGRGGNVEEKEAAEAEIKEFLGDEGYAEYQNFEDTKYGRGKVEEISKVFGAGLSMNAEQSDKMVDLMGGMEEFESDFRRDAGWGRWNRGAEESAVDLDQRLDQLETEYNQVLSDSSEVLDERQLEALSTHFENNLQRAEQGIQMANERQKMMENIITPESRDELRKMFEGFGGRR